MLRVAAGRLLDLQLVMSVEAFSYLIHLLLPTTPSLSTSICLRHKLVVFHGDICIHIELVAVGSSLAIGISHLQKSEARPFQWQLLP